ncbi:MAG: phosphoribosylformylglycinamidine synthase I [Dehalococcoidales bacterium]|nr:phosphoribosylformylglycinamidine synthase I [Dehalococcoidales bacterium]
MAKVKVLVVRAPGANCDAETAFAFQQAGAAASLVHINRLIHGEERLADYQIMVIPGGFTYGDDVAAGKVLANELKLKLGDDVRRFVEEGMLVMGICNGFQALVKAGFLPELSAETMPQVTLATNDSGKFECRWVYLGVNRQSPCVFTRDMDSLYLPVAHGEGKLVALPGALLYANVVLYYTDERGNSNVGYPHNPNGSSGNVAGICDSSGRIFGLMPHPERHIRGTQHPRWTRLSPREHGDGFQVFRNAVEWIERL